MNYTGIVENIIELAEERLNDWEYEFIHDMHIRIDRGQKLTDKQKKCILDIQTKYLKQ